MADSERGSAIVLGSPILGDRIETERIAETLLGSDETDAFARRINGSFLLVAEDRSKGELTVINDRFASIPLFYRLEASGELFGSISYTEILSKFGGTSAFGLQEERFYEFIHLQRLLGDGTYDTRTRFLGAASILRYSSTTRELRLSRYWRPDFEKDDRASLSDSAHALSDAIRGSLKSRTSDAQRYGLLLSGGLDSRTILAAFEEPVICFTVGETRNNEYRVASAVAKVRGVPHVFVKRAPEHYAEILDQAVALGSAMNVYDHAHFLNLGDEISSRADVVFHGHGLDYLFQGIYLPTRRTTIAGRPTYVERLRPIEDRVAEEYVDSVKYRLKSIDPASIVKPEHRQRMRDSLMASVEAVLRDGASSCQDEYDLWEYMHLHNLSRHYTFLNLLSIRTFAEERTVAFDNRIFDLYLRMPVKHRLSGRVLKGALKGLNGDLASLVSANTDLAAGYGPYAATGAKLGRGILRKLRMKTATYGASGAGERSWPDRDEMVRASQSLTSLVKGLPCSDRLASLAFIDMDNVASYVDGHLNGKGNYGALLLTLLTIDRLLSHGQAARGAGVTVTEVDAAS